MKTLLNDGWKLKEAPLDWGRDKLAAVLGDSDGWMALDIPGPVQAPLIENGRIKDPVLADYCFDGEWIEKRSWWFVKEFEASPAQREAEVVELVLESLDASSDVFLNGEWLGHHGSAFYPFVRGVKGRLKDRNTLCVRLTTGLEKVSDEDLCQINWAVCTEESNGCAQRGDKRRAFVRKPAYTVGWDWGPRVISCGIMKDVYLRIYNKTAIRHVHVYTQRIEGGAAHVVAQLTVDQLHVYATRDADISLTLSYGGEVKAAASLKDVLLTSGENFITMELDVPQAMLWWPAGLGAPNLYTVNVRVTCEGESEDYPEFRVGLRTVRLDLSRQSASERKFMLEVNGREVFCKGGDWIPADSIYARVTPEKYRRLIGEARSCNFNMLRVWGGGIYEADLFYRLLDEMGIMLWHDFMFGCTAAPDHHAWFRREVESELDYQTKRLANHASIVLWCGNNENQYIFNPEENPQWHIDMGYEKQYGLYCCNVLAKRAVFRNCAEIPYWNSSPYGGALPNDDNVGDVHHWNACMMNKDVNRRIEPKAYDQVKARFVTEYGYPGPCALESIETYFDGHPIDREGAIWDLHNNTFEKTTVAAGIRKHYLDRPQDLTMEQYLLYAGLTQSLMLEYSLEAIRFQNDCGGALFWMFNDTWGEVGWTIIDYYLHRKISFYGVKRAFAPVKLTLREANGQVILQGCNDKGAAVELKGVRVGYLSFDGTVDLTHREDFTLPPCSRAYLLTCALPQRDMRKGAFVAIPETPDVQPAMLRTTDIRNLRLEDGEVTIMSEQAAGEDLQVDLVSPRFLHAVHCPGGYACSDNYFDLLPGVVKTVCVKGAAGKKISWTAVPMNRG